MEQKKKRATTKWIILLPLLSVFLAFATTLIVVVNSEKEAYAELAKHARIEYVKNARFNAKDRIDKLVDYINFNESYLKTRAQNEIKDIVLLGKSVAQEVYYENAQLPKNVIFEKIEELLGEKRFFNNLEGYYFVFDMQGVNIVHGGNRAFVGQNLINVQDGEGKHTIYEVIQKLQGKEGIYHQWQWKNPGDEHFRTKIGYIAYIEELDILIGSARYEDEISKEIKEEAQKLLINTRYGESGYIFAHDYNGVAIAHGNAKEIGQNRLNVISGGQYIVRDFINGAKILPDGFFINYIATYRPDGKSNMEKLSYFRAIPQFEWVIGTGIYLEEEIALLGENEKVYKAKMSQNISNIASISFLVMLVIASILFVIASKINAVLARYEAHLLISNQKIIEQKQVFETLYQKSADGIVLLRDNHLIDCNEAIVGMYKAKNKKQLLNILASDASPEFQPDGESSVTKSLRMNAIALEKGAHQFEWHARALDGSLFWVSVNVTAIAMKEGTILHCSARDISANKALEEESKKQKKLLAYQVEHDALTGLPNRNLLQDRLSQAIKKANREASMLGIVFIDIDKFKSINDTLGHDVGDEFLKTIAEKMKSSMRQSDTVARLSGDEFIVLIDECKELNDISIAIKKLLLTFQAPIFVGHEQFKVSMSMGVSVYPNDGDNVSVLLKNADIAMYKAKAEGKNRYKFFDSLMNKENNEHLEIEQSLYKALEREEFELYYQPQLDIRNERIVGLEALIRWNHPSKGLLFPGSFINIAEESELIVDIGNWVLNEGLRQVQAWRAMGLEPGKLAINFAGKQLESATLLEAVSDALQKSGAAPEHLEMEVVERFIMKDSTKSIALLKRIRTLGVDISIDDFGTGHSSLAYLKHLPITKLKIDQSFVQGLEESKEDRAITCTIIELGRGLGLKVLAEGVESAWQKEFIFNNGCELMQGYFFSKPICAKAMEALLKNQVQML